MLQATDLKPRGCWKPLGASRPRPEGHAEVAAGGWLQQRKLAHAASCAPLPLEFATKSNTIAKRAPGANSYIFVLGVGFGLGDTPAVTKNETELSRRRRSAL